MNNDREIDCLELEKWQAAPGKFSLIDMRDAVTIEYGMIPGSVHISPMELRNRITEFPKNQTMVIYCANGIKSIDEAEYAASLGYDAYSLKKGYNGWVVMQMANDMEQNDIYPKKDDIEFSIRKKFHKDLFSKFAKAINEYELLKAGDKVAVCISGGKDSFLMAKLFQELKRHNKFEFELVFLVMDPGYSPDNRKMIERNAKLMDIPVTIFESDIFDSVFNVEKNPCYLCARMRRGHLYSKAKELGCNKIALGHHYDDVIETILMGMLYGGQVQTMMPKLHSTNFEGMELIRPMYLIREEDIKHWRDYNELHFLQCACKFTETCTSCSEDGASNSKRMEIKKLIASLKEINPFIEHNIFSSVENVNLNTVIAYKLNGERHSFLETYDSSIVEEE